MSTRAIECYNGDGGRRNPAEGNKDSHRETVVGVAKL